MTLTDEMVADKYVVVIASLVTTIGFSKQFLSKVRILPPAPNPTVK